MKMETEDETEGLTMITPEVEQYLSSALDIDDTAGEDYPIPTEQATLSLSKIVSSKSTSSAEIEADLLRRAEDEVKSVPAFKQDWSVAKPGEYRSSSLTRRSTLLSQPRNDPATEGKKLLKVRHQPSHSSCYLSIFLSSKHFLTLVSPSSSSRAILYSCERMTLLQNK
jgi:hypothetical protein